MKYKKITEHQYKYHGAMKHIHMFFFSILHIYIIHRERSHRLIKNKNMQEKIQPLISQQVY